MEINGFNFHKTRCAAQASAPKVASKYFDAASQQPYAYNLGMAVELWDTFGLFETLLKDFDVLMGHARAFRAANPGTRLPNAVALIGFAQFSPIEAWNSQHSEFIDSRLQNEFSSAAFDWYEEHAQAVWAFSTLTIGALLGKLQASEIDDAGFLLGDAHLVAFTSSNAQSMTTRYAA